jgi:hypothetical protein
VGPGQREGAELTDSGGAAIEYSLGADAVKKRARATSAIATAAMFAPVALVVVLLRRLGYGTGPAERPALAIACGVFALVCVRAFVEARRLRRRLERLRVVAGADELRIETEAGTTRVPRAAIARAVEIDGLLGGVRLELRDLDDAPERVDLPRGGEAFGALRARIASWTPVERAPRRGRAARIAIGVVVIAAIFFLPFILEDFFGRSKPAALALVLGLWIALRLLARR